MSITMGVTGSLVLLALGAILAFAVTVTTEGFDINTIGVILMIVGALGLVLSMIFWSSWGGFNNNRGNTTVVERDREIV